MKAKRIIGILCIGVILLGATVLCMTLHKPFPIWERAEERQINTDARLTFVALEQNESNDIVVVTLKNEGDGELRCGGPYSIEYLNDGVWYTVCEIGGGPSVDQAIGSHQEVNERILVPKDLLNVPGTYRVYVDEVGYCEIEIKEENKKS